MMEQDAPFPHDHYEYHDEPRRPEESARWKNSSSRQLVNTDPRFVRQTFNSQIHDDEPPIYNEPYTLHTNIFDELLDVGETGFASTLCVHNLCCRAGLDLQSIHKIFRLCGCWDALEIDERTFASICRLVAHYQNGRYISAEALQIVPEHPPVFNIEYPRQLNDPGPYVDSRQVKKKTHPWESEAEDEYVPENEYVPSRGMKRTLLNREGGGFSPRGRSSIQSGSESQEDEFLHGGSPSTVRNHRLSPQNRSEGAARRISNQGVCRPGGYWDKCDTRMYHQTLTGERVNGTPRDALGGRLDKLAVNLETTLDQDQDKVGAADNVRDWQNLVRTERRRNADAHSMLAKVSAQKSSMESQTAELRAEYYMLKSETESLAEKTMKETVDVKVLSKMNTFLAGQVESKRRDLQSAQEILGSLSMSHAAAKEQNQRLRASRSHTVEEKMAERSVAHTLENEIEGNLIRCRNLQREKDSIRAEIGIKIHEFKTVDEERVETQECRRNLRSVAADPRQESFVGIRDKKGIPNVDEPLNLFNNPDTIAGRSTTGGESNQRSFSGRGDWEKFDD